jgi:hypothetical protein
MIHPITAILIALVAMGGLAAPVHGGLLNISGTLEGDSTLTPTGTPGVYVQSFTGDGDDTTFGAFTPTSTSTIDFSKPPQILLSGGMLTEAFTQGNLLGTSSGSGTGNGKGVATVTIDFVITGGTKLFAGAAGEATITATITQTSATTESITGTYVGSLTTVPEPSTFILLAPAVAVAALGVALRRRRAAMARSSC